MYNKIASTALASLLSTALPFVTSALAEEMPAVDPNEGNQQRQESPIDAEQPAPDSEKQSADDIGSMAGLCQKGFNIFLLGGYKRPDNECLQRVTRGQILVDLMKMGDEGAFIAMQTLVNEDEKFAELFEGMMPAIQALNKDIQQRKLEEERAARQKEWVFKEYKTDEKGYRYAIYTRANPKHDFNDSSQPSSSSEKPGLKIPETPSLGAPEKTSKDQKKQEAGQQPLPELRAL